MNDFLQGFAGCGRVRAREEMHPKQRDRLVVFFQFTRRRCEPPQRIAHLTGGLVYR